MSGIMCSRIQVIKKILPVVTRRFVSTSKKNDTVTAEVFDAAKTKDKGTAVEKDWISYGYDFSSKKADRNAAHSVMFVSITVCIVFGGFFLAYMPDLTMRDWSQREAFLELHRREEKGLPLVDANLIDPSKISLPSDEELEDVEIII